MCAASTYENFDLLIEQTQGDNYRAWVVDSPVGEATVDFRLPFSQGELCSFFWLSGRVFRDLRLERDGPEPAHLTPQEFGIRLYQQVFAGQVGTCLLRSLDSVGEEAGLRLRLRLDRRVPELADLPWEFLYAPELSRFIVLSGQTVIARYIELLQPQRPLLVTSPLRILAMISDPSDAPTLKVEQEWGHLQASLANLRGIVTLERLERATLSALQDRLRGEDVHILHYIGHGYYDEDAASGGLLLEDENGRGGRVDANRLATLLHDHASLRLVFLNACEGARSGRDDLFAGTAHRLVSQKTPAVIAMQFRISDRAALILAQEFYEALADGYPVDAALAEARKAVYALGDDLEWGTPVLYLRAPDGRIFDIERVAEPECRGVVTHPRGLKPDTRGMGTTIAAQSKERGVSERPNKQSGGVSIGDVTGGIHGSIIAGRDVSNATITLGGLSTPADKEPTLDELKQLLAEIQNELAGITAQQEALQAVSTAAPFTAQGAQASVQQAADQLEAEIEKEQAGSVQQSLIEATNLLSGILDGAKTMAEKAGEVSQAVKPLAEMLAPLVEKLGVAAFWVAKL